jgi:hypothetical protein
VVMSRFIDRAKRSSFHTNITVAAEQPPSC